MNSVTWQQASAFWAFVVVVGAAIYFIRRSRGKRATGVINNTVPKDTDAK